MHRGVSEFHREIKDLLCRFFEYNYLFAKMLFLGDRHPWKFVAHCLFF